MIDLVQEIVEAITGNAVETVVMTSSRTFVIGGFLSIIYGGSCVEGVAAV